MADADLLPDAQGVAPGEREEQPTAPERQEPAYRFPAIEPKTAEFTLTLPSFPEATEGFTGSLDALLEGLRAGSLSLKTLPLAPLVDQYLTFRRLEPEEESERISDFLPLAATLIHLKSRLLLPREPAQNTDQQVREEIVAEIRRQERQRREQQTASDTARASNEGYDRLTLLDLMVLLNDVQSSLRAPLSVTEEGLAVRDAMHWIRRSLPDNAALAAETYFAQCATVRDQAAVFLAVLELGRTRSVECHQTEAFAPLWLCLRP